MVKQLNVTSSLCNVFDPVSSGKMLGYSDMRGLLDIIQSSKIKQAEATSSSVSWSAEMGYLNLTSPQGRLDHLAPSDSFSSTDSNEV